ncbi:MAG: hypothetical protein IJ751_06600 [Oscillospiraceae bacterium]|nr:hypothetical protein [Oscillospiraceae bacterium]
MQYTVLSPWARVDTAQICGLSPRLDTLNGKTIGMFADLFMVGVRMQENLEAELRRRYPDVNIKYIRYTVETKRIEDDPEFRAEFDAWAADCDAVLSFYGCVPSSTLFLGYNSAYIEKLGKPVVIVTNERVSSSAQRGLKACGVPALRHIRFEMPPDAIFGRAPLEVVREQMGDRLTTLADQVVEALTAPLTAEEANPTRPEQTYADATFTGTAAEISRLFYKHGWTNGAPIDMPTREAVDEMMRGTDLPADYVVAKLPPMMGLATVEKIAVNAVMAGCLPTYMPVLIAAIRGALAENIKLEAWSCSQSTWGPVLNISGKVARDIGLNTDGNLLSPYYKANATLGRAFSMMMMNIGGVRPGFEDLSEMGHEFRTGFCTGDSLEQNPWQPLHMDFGLAEEDSAVTMFWPQEHRAHSGSTIPDFLHFLCTVNPYGWEPGMEIIFSPKCAKMFAEAGWTKQKILDYVVEYARRPASEVDLGWLINNAHEPANVPLPVCDDHYTRTFWTKEHMFVIVGGGQAGCSVAVLGGGGDHGGPSCTKIELPANWDALVAEYNISKPDYIEY